MPRLRHDPALAGVSRTDRQVVVAAPAAEVEALLDELNAADVTAENWTESIAPLCKACSLGRVDYDSPEHEHHGAAAEDGTTAVGCSGDLAVRPGGGALVGSGDRRRHRDVGAGGRLIR